MTAATRPAAALYCPVPCQKLLHDATDFSLLPPGVELDMATLRVDMAYRVRVDERKVGTRVSEVVEGTWLGAELLAWTAKQRLTSHTGTQFQVRVFKAAVDLNTPSDGTQLMMPNKEQLRLEKLRAAKESWLQALRAAGLASRARQDAALAQASRQALLEDLWHASAGSAMSLRQLRLALAAI